MGTYIHRVAFTVVLALVFTLTASGESSAYEDKECLVCHKDYGRAGETLPEGVSKLYVNEEEWKKDVHFDVEQWKKDVHAELVGLACDDCHLDATPETHPEAGLQKVNCAECHEEQADSYYKTVHWTAEVPAGKRKPDCPDCHNPHAMLSRANPTSSLYKGNIKASCLSCHEDMESTFSLSSKLLLFRISAHRKADPANPFDRSECVNCHFTRAVGHGDDPLTEAHCGQCHVQGASAEKAVFGPFHLGPSLQERPLVTLIEVINLLMLLALLAALVVWLARGLGGRRENKKAQEPGG